MLKGTKGFYAKGAKNFHAKSAKSKAGNGRRKRRGCLIYVKTAGSQTGILKNNQIIMLVKVCGMRDPENIRSLMDLSVDFMGLIFYKKSSRNVPDSMAEQILQAVDGKVPKVGVFVNESVDTVLQKVARFKLQYVQLHGQESSDYCYDLLEKSARMFGCDDELRLIKAFSVDEHFDFSVTRDYTPYCEYFLFDTKGKNAGGNGVMFDWNLLKKYAGTIPFLLSGGLDQNSAEDIRQLDFPKLIGTDVNSRFEDAPAFKNIDKVKIFVEELS